MAPGGLARNTGLKGAICIGLDEAMTALDEGLAGGTSTGLDRLRRRG